MKYVEIKNILNSIDSPVEKLEMLMNFGKELSVVPTDAVCTDILGCSSMVQICRKDNHFYAKADSDIVKGIVAVLISMVDGKTPQEIKNMDLQAEFDSLNLKLGIARIGGLNSMILFLKNL